MANANEYPRIPKGWLDSAPAASGKTDTAVAPVQSAGTLAPSRAGDGNEQDLDVLRETLKTEEGHRNDVYRDSVGFPTWE